MIDHSCLSEAEILEKYRRADDKDEMVSVLADLTDCSFKEMAKFLCHKAQGGKQPHATNVAKDKRLELYNSGMRDCDIARAVGKEAGAIRQWREYHRLPANYK